MTRIHERRFRIGSLGLWPLIACGFCSCAAPAGGLAGRSAAIPPGAPADAPLVVRANDDCPVPPEPRIPLSREERDAGAGADEYVYDGGDRLKSALPDSPELRGLESEDTVGEFTDAQGRRQQRHSNRVAIYAPRFGSIVHVSTVNDNTGASHVYGANVTLHGGGVQSKTVGAMHAQRLQTGRLRGQMKLNSLATDAAQRAIASDQRRAVAGSARNAHEAVRNLHNASTEQTQHAVMAEHETAAKVWTRSQYPIIQAQVATLERIETLQRSADVTGLELSGKPGVLRIQKLADKAAAAPGDVVEFTIRFENAGDEPLQNVAVLDSLTTRLVYVDGSAACAPEADVETIDNSEGSVILRFALKEPLEARSKGVITFQARVR